jgi:pimeloyl-ACP methyl ester carboxylesterase
MGRYPRRRVRVDEHTITLDEAPVFYRAAPSAGAPVLYLHGVPTSADDWTPFLERTGGIAPDLPGFGRSSKAGHLDYSIDGHASFVEQLLAELGVDRVKVVAHDWGAAAGLAFAQRHPDRVERLVLCNALPLLDGFRWHRLARAWRRPVLGELLMGSTTKWLLARTLRRGCVDPGSWPPARIAAVWEQFDQGTQRAILRLHRATPEAKLVEAGASLNALDVAALVIWGERDPWFPVELAGAYAARLSNATTELVADAGHWPWLDQPSVVDRVAAFVGER